eukprot:2242691-Rhodomonas_salina.2
MDRSTLCTRNVFDFATHLIAPRRASTSPPPLSLPLAPSLSPSPPPPLSLAICLCLEGAVTRNQIQETTFLVQIALKRRLLLLDFGGCWISGCSTERGAASAHVRGARAAVLVAAYASSVPDIA